MTSLSFLLWLVYNRWVFRTSESFTQLSKRNDMRNLLFVLTCALITMPAMAVEIDLGVASNYNAFIKKSFKVTSSDTQGRIAVGGNLVVNGGYDIGYRIDEFGMGSGPSLVVGGNIVKKGQGHFNVYEDGPHQSPHSGDVLYAGSVTDNKGRIEANLIQTDKANLPVNFNDAFAHLNKLSKDLAAVTAHGVGVKDGWPLVFKPTTTPDNNVYVFNVTQEQINSTNEWSVEGVSADATVVFNVTNPNKVAGKSNYNKNECAQGAKSCVHLSQTNIKINGELLSEHYQKGYLNNNFKQQVLFNFAGATQVNLATDLYASVLAPKADIKANPSVIWGQVIGKSWQGNMQINYSPFTPIGGGTTPVPTPASLWIFALAIALVYVNRRTINKRMTKLKNKKLKAQLHKGTAVSC